MPASYLALAVLLTWRIWADPRHVALNGGNDINLNVWFMRYVEVALAHGHLPALVTKAVNAPQGLNVMWNTSLLAPGVVLAPVTWLAGPVFSLAVLTTLGFAGSAAAMYWVLRRWDAGMGAAAIGGALYGLRQAIMIAANDHYHLQFAVLPPLIIDAAARLATGRGSPIKTGIWLGVLITLQVFIAEELLLDTAIAGAVLMLVLVVNRPRHVVRRAPGAIAGVAIAVAVVSVMCAYPFYRQFHGPLAEHGSPWHTGQYGNHLAEFVIAPHTVLLNNPVTFTKFLVATGQWPLEDYAYLGWPFILAAIVATIVYWRDIKVRVAGLSFFGLEWLSMGGHSQQMLGRHVSHSLFPWHYLAKLPVFNELVVTRLSILSDGLGAVALAFAAAHVITAARSQEGWRKPAFISAATVTLAAIVVPLIPRPIAAQPVVPRPAGWQTVIDKLHLPPDAPVLTLAVSSGIVMEWQATSGVPISIVGGYCVAPGPLGKAAPCGTKVMMTGAERTTTLRVQWLTDGSGEPGPNFKTMVVALRQWGADAVLVPPADPVLATYMTDLLGKPTARQGGVLGWRLGRHWYRHLAVRLGHAKVRRHKKASGKIV